MSGTWLLAVVLLAVWAGAPATSHASARWIAGVVSAVATVAIGWMLASGRLWNQARTLALVGGVAWGGANAFFVIANPGADPLPWGVVVGANVAIGLVVVPVVAAIGAGARLVFDRLTPSRSA